jgi:hypothetical protein
MNKKAQLTLYILLSIVIVTIMVLLFIFKDKITFSTNPIDNPDTYLKNCIENSIKLSEETIINTNGFSSKDTYVSVLYKSKNIPYLCTSYEYYSPCVPQEPMFVEKQRILMENKAAVDFKNCISVLRKELEKKGYSVRKDDSSIKISFAEDIIKASVEMDFVSTKDESSTKLQSIEIIYPSKLYSIFKTAQTVVNYESSFCEFNHMAWSSSQSGIIIKKETLSDQTNVYAVSDRDSEKEIKFAIRTCVLPAGL